jgi:hypothetical protein
LSVTPLYRSTGCGYSGCGLTANLGFFQISVYYNSGGQLNVAQINVPGLQTNVQGPTTPAVLSTTVASGAITGCSVTSGGAGYPGTPNLILSGNGTGATGTLTMVGGVITACAITAGGTGYTSASAAPQNGSYIQLFGGVILQYATGATVPASPPDGVQQTIQLPYVFPHACLAASLTTQVVAAVGSGDAIFQQVGPCGTSSVTATLQAFSSSTSGTTYTPQVMAIGW